MVEDEGGRLTPDHVKNARMTNQDASSGKCSWSPWAGNAPTV